MNDLRLLVAITFHYRESRLEILLAVVRAYLSFAVAAVDLVIVTNTNGADEVERITAILTPLAQTAVAPQFRVRVESYPGLADPWHLPWSHKHLIKDRFLADADYTHFIYCEDDLLVSSANFSYWLRFRELLDRHGLIPSFQQIEYNHIDGHLYLVAQAAPDAWDGLKKIEAGELRFVTPSYPYCACYVLDRRLAEEYCRSRSFDQEFSRGVAPHWGVAERAATGLCFEDVPPGFHSRHAVPVDPARMSTISSCWIFHLPNNYATRPNTAFGKIRPDRMFRADFTHVQVACSARPSQFLQSAGHVDELRIGTRSVYISGWGRLQVEQGECTVVVHTNLAIAGCRIVMIPRPDVVAALGDEKLAWSGFQVYLELDASAAPAADAWLHLSTRDSVYGSHVLTGA